jgi:hypothetical protein
MKSPKTSQLGVSLSMGEVSSFRRSAELIQDPSGYSYFKFSGERTEVPITAEAFTGLLKVVKPPMLIDRNEETSSKKLIRTYSPPELDPDEVIGFVNRFGMIGLSQSERRKSARNINDPLGLFLITNMHPATTQQLFDGDRGMSELIRERLYAISDGDEIPYSWVVGILRDLAKSARMFAYLQEDKSKKSGDPIQLTTPNRKRITAAWNYAGGVFKDGEDPAGTKFSTRDEWVLRTGDNEFNVLELAEMCLSQFAEKMNQFLSPISTSVVAIESFQTFYQRNIGFETAFACYLVRRLQEIHVKRICQECKIIYFPDRYKVENLFCSQRCGKVGRNKRHRAKKKAQKVSVKKTESKKTTKARKEKK